jgi:polyhydroxybutyrate depolymerase
MISSFLVLTTFCLGQGARLGPGDHLRSLQSGGMKRFYLLHVPPSYDPKRPTPVVMALHGLSMNAVVMEWFTGLNKVANREGFIVLYPNGTGPVEVLRGWNAGAFPGDANKDRPDDVAFLSKVLDDAEAVLNVDVKRVYVTGMSNGGMMAYRLACVMPERIAAVASVTGTLPADDCQPKRPVPVLHFHGTKDPLVPYEGLKDKMSKVFKYRSVEDTIDTWVKIDGCDREPSVTELPAKRDKYRVVRKEYGNCQGDAEVVLYVIEGGGHAWFGMHYQPPFLGASTDNVNANEVMWDFFKKHRLP